MTAAAKKHLADHLGDIAELERVALSKVRADVAVYARTARHIAVTGDIREFDTPPERAGHRSPGSVRQEDLRDQATQRALTESPSGHRR